MTIEQNHNKYTVVSKLLVILLLAAKEEISKRIRQLIRVILRIIT